MESRVTGSSEASHRCSSATASSGWHSADIMLPKRCAALMSRHASARECAMPRRAIISGVLCDPGNSASATCNTCNGDHPS